MIDTSKTGAIDAGGTSGVSIDEAVAWYRENRGTCERPVVIALRKRFGLKPYDACRVIALVSGRPA